MKNFIAGCLLLLIGSVLGIAVGEIGLRVLDISFPSFYQPDHYRGAALRPGAEGWYRDEGESYVVINSRGLRDREHTVEKSPRSFRVAVLGDSYAEALQLPAEQAFWAEMERELSNCSALSGREPEAINFGVSGYATSHSLQTLRHYVWEYEPDAVVYAMTTSNDIRDNSITLGSTVGPFFMVDGEKLVVDNSFRESSSYLARTSLVGRIAYALIDYSRILQVLNHVRNLMARRARMEAEPVENDTVEGFEDGLTPEIYAEPQDAVWKDAWQVTEALIAEMHGEVRERDIPFLLATLTNSIQVVPEPEVREKFRAAIGVDDLFYPERRLGDFATQGGINFVPLAFEFVSHADSTGEFLHGYENYRLGAGHWNQAGHELGGRLIARALCASL